MHIKSVIFILICAASSGVLAGSDPAQRCPADGEWTDEVVADSIKLSVDRLSELRVARSLTNQDVCTMPEAKLKRALFRLETPKPDSPGDWAKLRALQQKSDNGIVKANGLWQAFLERKQIVAAQKQSGTLTTMAAGISPNQWVNVGPGNIGGRVRTIAVHPTNANKLWAGSVGGGIWASDNAGASWSPVNDFMANIAISSIVIDRTNTNILYAGTGESFAGDGIRGAGVFKSTDGGVTWAQLAATNPASNSDWYYVSRIVIHPANGSILLAGTQNGIYRSSDGGANWSKVYSGNAAQDLRFDPNNGGNVVAGIYNTGVYYSRDAGATWIASPTTGMNGRIELAYAKASPNVVFAALDYNYGKIYRSTDGGQNWTYLSNPQHLGGQGWYANTIWVDPVNSSNLVIGGLDLFRSTDGGSNWVRISTWWAAPRSAHADQHYIVSDPNYNGSTNRRVYFANDGGVYRADDVLAVTDDTNGAGGWTSLNNGLSITQFYGGAGNASGTLIGGTQDNGSLLYTGNANDWKMYAGGDGGFAGIDSTDSRFLFGEYQNMALHRSRNGGATLERISDGLNDQYYNFIAPLMLDPNDSNRLLAGGSQLWLTTNAKGDTVTMKSIKPATSNAYNNISAIAVRRGDSNIIWVGHNDGSLYRSSNGMAASPTWTKISATLPSRYVTRVLIDPDNAQKVYVAYGGYEDKNLYMTSNNGSTWTDISGNIPSAPIRGLARHPSKPGWLYAGTEVGIFTSENDGSTWSAANDGPANVSVEDLLWLYNANTSLVAVTHGRGMFKVDLSPGFACKNYADTNPNHVSAGRAYAKTSGTWTTTTTYYARNSNANLGTSKTTQVKLAEIFPGYFQPGTCPTAPVAPKIDTINATPKGGLVVTIAGTASDANDDISKIEVQIDEAGPWMATNGTTNWTIELGLITYGVHKARARATDSTNLVSPLSASVSFELKNQPPCVTAKNTLHISEGRAHQCGTTFSPKACANGSNNDLGSSLSYYPATSSISQTGTNYWVKVASCP